MAVGQDYTGTMPPLLAASTDGGNTWSKRTIVGAPSTGDLYGATCTGSGSTAICFAAGGKGSFRQNPPLLVGTTDGGTTWGVTTIKNNPSAGYFIGTKCTGTGTTAVCVAGGEDFTGTSPALLAASTDGGVTWSTQTISGNPATGLLFGYGKMALVKKKFVHIGHHINKKGFPAKQ